jgi:hypothetical protein
MHSSQPEISIITDNRRNQTLKINRQQSKSGKEVVMSKNFVLPVLNLLAVIGTIIVNGLANALPLNGQNTGDISDRFVVYFTPAGYVFSIWGLIFLALVAFGLYQVLPAQWGNKRLQRIGGWFLLSSLANVAWLFLWHYEFFIWTVPVMLVLLLSLIVIYQRLQIGRVKTSAVEKWTVDVPFGLYLGWITVATIANITSIQYLLKWDGWGISPELWTAIMLGAGVIIAALVGKTRSDIAYLLVIIWAFVGIAVKHPGVPPVSLGAWVAAGLVALVLVAVVLGAGRRSATLQPTVK